MLKTKWVKFSVQKSQDQIVSALSMRQFSKAKPIGFELLEVVSSRIHGKFIQEIVDTDVFIDPFGEEIKNISYRYVTIQFYIFFVAEGRFLLRVDNPPRTLKNLISLMSEVLGRDFFVSSLSVDLLKFIDFFTDSSIVKDVLIKKAYLNNVRIKEGSLAKISVSSEINAYKELLESLDLSGSSFDRAFIELIVERKTAYNIEISSSGTIIGSEPFLFEYNFLICQFFTIDDIGRYSA